MTLGDHILEDTQKRSEEPSDLSTSIDVYYTKQEECQKLAEETDQKYRDKDTYGKDVTKHTWAPPPPEH